MSKEQTITALAIGEKVPNLQINQIMNAPTSSIRLSEFKNKLLILDFMSTGCIPCIEELPAFDSLQNKYKNELQIILVIQEPVSSVRSFFKRKNISAINLPAVANDTTLSKLFPHIYLPHEVWINNDRVIAITQPEYVIDKNIQLILQNKKINMPTKSDFAFDYQQPLLHWNEKDIPYTALPKKSYYTSFSSYMPNVATRITAQNDSVKNIFRISMINVPIIDLYMRILNGSRLKPSFIILKVTDSTRYQYDKTQGFYQEWLLKNTYCYEAVFPLNMPKEEVKSKIKNDLDFYLSLDGKMIKKQVECWVISKSPDEGKIKISEVPNNIDPAKNASINDILYYMNKDFGNIPCIDETGCGQLKIKGLARSECTDLAILKIKLKEYGLRITKSLRYIDMMIISENKSN